MRERAGGKEDRKQKEGDQGGWGERGRPGGRRVGDGSWPRGVKRMEGV